MSAIAGILNLDGRPVEPGVIERMIGRLGHWGDGKRSVWREGTVALALQERRQLAEGETVGLPEAGGLAITGDVRLDNRGELRRLLGEFGPPGGAMQDCALALGAYEKWGEECVERFLGEFAFAIWDRERQKLFCARDPMGIKPFYYSIVRDRSFVFATELKAIMAVAEVSEVINELKVADAFLHVFNDPAATYYREISRLPAAHTLSVGQTVRMRRYWRLNAQRELRLGSDAEYAESFIELFQKAVVRRMRGGEAVGAMLSGGLDSSSIACVARDWLRREGRLPLQTFSGVFNEVTECDERPYINAVLDQGHCTPHYLAVDSVSPLAEVEKMIWSLDGPFWASNLYLCWHSYRQAEKAGVRVMLDGFDGDTTISHGAGRLGELAQARQWGTLAHELRLGAKNLGIASWPGCFWQWYQKFSPSAARLGRLWSRATQRNGGGPGANAGGIIEALNPDLVSRLDLKNIARAPSKPAKTERENHAALLERDALTECVEMLAHIAAPFRVEPRFPFMDVQLIEFCLSLPPEQKLKNGQTRHVLRNGMAGVLPRKIQRRQGKSNLSPSLEKGLRKFERQNLGRLVASGADRLGPYVDLRRVQACIERFCQGVAQPGDVVVVWNAAALAVWLEGRRGQAHQFSPQKKEVRQE